MHSIRELIKLSTDYLEKKKITSPRLCSEVLLAFVLKIKRLDLFLDYDQLLQTNEVDQYRSLMQRKGKGEPLGYLLGNAEFLGCHLTLSPSALIPRQETEILVNLALKEISNEPKALWDLCCGSGAMGLAAKKHHPKLDVTLADISEDSLALAKENALGNHLEVKFKQGDLLFPFIGEKADIIFCNPPYVSEDEYSQLEKEVHFEPKCAHVAQDEGFEFYKRLAKELPAYLNPDAKVFLEIGHQQSIQVRAIFSKNHWKSIRCEKDWSGKDRFFFLEFSPELP